jgi:hypothetical protein
MIEGIAVGSDEDGFYLRLTGDFAAAFRLYLDDPVAYSVELRFPEEIAEQLEQQVHARITPWVAEMLQERAAYRRATPDERALVFQGQTEDFLEQADLLRKRLRENGE